MAKPKTNREKDVPPSLPRAEWDFSKVPSAELVACLIWEYLRERPKNLLYNRRAVFSVLQWTYDSWDDRKKLNTRYQNTPKNTITVAAKWEALPPWQTLDSETRKLLAVPAKRREALIPLTLSSQTLWEWTHTFKPEQNPLEFEVWFNGMRDLLAGLSANTRRQFEESGNELLSSILGGTFVPEKPGEKCEEDVDAAEIFAALKPDRSELPMDLVVARLSNFVSQPDFLINWQEYDKPAIKRAFAKWLDEAEPKNLKPHVENSEARPASLLKDLESLGIMRLLHVYTPKELVEAEPTYFKRYADGLRTKELYKLRNNAIRRFGMYAALKQDEVPLSAGTKGGRSDKGR